LFCGIRSVLLIGPEVAPSVAHVREKIMKRKVYVDSAVAHSASRGGANGESNCGHPAGTKRLRTGGAVYSASDLWLSGGDEHSPHLSNGLIVRFAARTTLEAHDFLLFLLDDLALRIGRLPYGPTSV
jgi:hypothetical protein